MVTINPNPANNFVELKIVSDYYGPLGFKITDLNGRTIIQSNEYKNERVFINKIDVSNLSQGTYFVFVTASGKLYNFKLLRN
jgi:hypothetical protein